jgi:hypothetical protein
MTNSDVYAQRLASAKAKEWTRYREALQELKQKLHGLDGQLQAVEADELRNIIEMALTGKRKR